MNFSSAINSPWLTLIAVTFSAKHGFVPDFVEIRIFGIHD